jgi:DNA-binding MarR family transcriptional regulator
MDKNSVKLYDKAYTSRGSVVRVETTLNDSSPFRVFRAKEGAPEEEKTWQTLRAGVADLARRAQVSQATNARYLGALAQVDDGAALGHLLERVQRPVTRQGRRTRALHPFETPDAGLLNAVSHGEFLLNGFRNHDLQTLLFSDAPRDAAEARRRSAQVSRALARLRTHGLVKKVPHEYRYHLAASGRTLAAAVLAAQAASVSALLDKAA